MAGGGVWVRVGGWGVGGELVQGECLAQHAGRVCAQPCTTPFQALTHQRPTGLPALLPCNAASTLMSPTASGSSSAPPAPTPAPSSLAAPPLRPPTSTSRAPPRSAATRSTRCVCGGWVGGWGGGCGGAPGGRRPPPPGALVTKQGRGLGAGWRIYLHDGLTVAGSFPPPPPSHPCTRPAAGGQGHVLYGRLRGRQPRRQHWWVAGQQVARGAPRRTSCARAPPCACACSPVLVGRAAQGMARRRRSRAAGCRLQQDSALWGRPLRPSATAGHTVVSSHCTCPNTPRPPGVPQTAWALPLASSPPSASRCVAGGLTADGVCLLTRCGPPGGIELHEVGSATGDVLCCKAPHSQPSPSFLCLCPCLRAGAPPREPGLDRRHHAQPRAASRGQADGQRGLMTALLQRPGLRRHTTLAAGNQPRRQRPACST